VRITPGYRVPATTVVNEWLRQGQAEQARGAPRIAHPGGTMSSNKEAATAKFLARKGADPE
jgi:hypothetical protein